MSQSSRSTESRNKNNKTWNPLLKMFSMVTRRTKSSSESSNSSDGENAILRWTAACINTSCPIFARNPQFNMIYTPISSLWMYVIVAFASEHAMTGALQSLFELCETDIKEIREMSQKISKLWAPCQFSCFVRFLVDEEKTTTVSKELMIRSNEVTSQQVFASIRPSRVIKYLSSLSFAPVTLSRPPLLTTNGYASAGVNAVWMGKARKTGIHRFACTYHKKKYEVFFEITTTYRTVNMEQFEVFEIPFKFSKSLSKTAGSFLILRPIFIGHLPYANHQLSAESIAKMLDDLRSSEWIPDGKVLLPQFSASCCHDLWKNLTRHGIQPDLGQSQKMPPIASLWHWASLKISAAGISGSVAGTDKKKGEKMTAEEKMLQKSFHDRVSTMSLFADHKAYSARIDSPFTYIVMVQGIPIFAGSFFGSPPPKSLDIFINAPERIRHHRTTISQKRKAKETRKQKLMKKVRKLDEKEKEKERKRKIKKRSASSSTSSESDNTTESSEFSPLAPKVTVIPKSEENEKSKSSRWKRFANRIFRRKS